MVIDVDLITTKTKWRHTAIRAFETRARLPAPGAHAIIAVVTVQCYSYGGG